MAVTALELMGTIVVVFFVAVVVGFAFRRQRGHEVGFHRREWVQSVPREWTRCPICDAELVGPYNPGASFRTTFGGGRLAPTRGELVGKCPVHGRRPYNDPDRRPPVRWVASDE